MQVSTATLEDIQLEREKVRRALVEARERLKEAEVLERQLRDRLDKSNERSAEATDTLRRAGLLPA
jgi:hypothetical protein